MEDGTQPVRKGCIVALVAVVAGAIGVMMWSGHLLVESATGKEHSPAEAEPRLRRALEKDFRWTGLPPGRLEGAWFSGFQDRLDLYRVRVSREEFASLRQAVLSSAAEGVRVDDADDLSSCPFGFATAWPQIPEGSEIPAWWQVSQLRSFDSLRWQRSDGGHWLCHDPEREVLFLLSYDG
ncbi:hypothetical protein OKA04_20745 [Luteolibacter flavescens]|uniref:Uncharacterized protein n=1 Tax=Luteolibacter flavescens TaxID=1859460 RepID=A0ABT3FUB5_9BACT|nr:hypothetical protein [Luteolibacter flavescens]MCW1887180.1 hypothetical protein [Luteolibacter flavescens]